MDPNRYDHLTFQPLTEASLPTLYEWLNTPHVREFYHKQSVPSFDETRSKYLRRIDPHWPTRCFLSCVGGRPIGYLQTYRAADYPDYAATIGETEGISVDLFIGEPGYLGIGWGRLVLLKFLAEIAFPLFPAEDVCWIYHEKLNQ